MNVSAYQQLLSDYSEQLLKLGQNGDPTYATAGRKYDILQHLISGLNAEVETLMSQVERDEDKLIGLNQHIGDSEASKPTATDFSKLKRMRDELADLYRSQLAELLDAEHSGENVTAEKLLLLESHAEDLKEQFTSLLPVAFTYNNECCAIEMRQQQTEVREDSEHTSIYNGQPLKDMRVDEDTEDQASGKSPQNGDNNEMNDDKLQSKDIPKGHRLYYTDSGLVLGDFKDADKTDRRLEAANRILDEKYTNPNDSNTSRSKDNDEILPRRNYLYSTGNIVKNMSRGIFDNSRFSKTGSQVSKTVRFGPESGSNFFSETRSLHKPAASRLDVELATLKSKQSIQGMAHRVLKTDESSDGIIDRSRNISRYSSRRRHSGGLGAKKVVFNTKS